jgi:SAM-dependent methyltransferase
MGGDINQPDERMTHVLRLLEYAPLDNVTSIVDIGMGKGQIAFWLAHRGKNVTGTGLEMDSYGVDVDALKEQNIRLVECPIEKMPFDDRQFDAAVMSHVLEHCANVGLALGEVRRVLKPNGWLFLFLPPTDDLVCAGHVSVGWSIGQIMYVLLLNGFDVKHGQYIEYGYNVCAFVQKTGAQLPPLRMDRGDIRVLHDRFPLPIRSHDSYNDGFFGRIAAVNWPDEFFKRWPPGSKTVRLARAMCRLLPSRIRPYLAARLIRVAHEMRYDSLINPPRLG